MKIVLAAILFLAPHLKAGEAQLFARLIDYEAAQAKIPALLVVAIVQMESGFNARARGPTADHGLAQVHVSKTNYPELLGHEYLLYDPVINIHLSVKLMKFWRRWHDTRCYPAHHHPWWSHLKWGKKIKDGGRSARERAGTVYEKLLEKFRPDV